MGFLELTFDNLQSLTKFVIIIILIIIIIIIQFMNVQGQIQDCHEHINSQIYTAT
jgi:cell division protein FtsL